MKRKFVVTQNVKRFVDLMDTLKNAPANLPKMALVYGDFGLGKSQTIMWWLRITMRFMFGATTKCLRVGF